MRFFLGEELIDKLNSHEYVKEWIMPNLTGLEDKISDDPLHDYANGLISRKEVLRLLDVTYFELLEMMAKAQLELPGVSKRVSKQMMKDMELFFSEKSDD